MAYFPFYMDISNQKGLIVGGGRIALHKIKKLLPFHPNLLVVAPEISPEIYELEIQTQRIRCQRRSFRKEDAEDAFFVIAATDEPKINATVSAVCKKKGIPVNAVDDKKHCSFLFPALVQRGKLTIGISTEGASPAVAALLRKQIDDAIPMQMDEILDYLEKLRPIAKKKFANERERAAYLKEQAIRRIKGGSSMPDLQGIKIIYEDDDLLVCHKPAGLATQTKRLGEKDLESCLKNYRAKKGEPPYIGVVHRLDQPVEGVMVFAKNKKANANLSKQVQDRKMGKYYLAYCFRRKGDVTPSEGRLTDYMIWNKQKNIGFVVDESTPNAKKAVLDYKVLKQEEKGVLFEIRLHTGRQHQIRLQLSHFGFPIIGDLKYGGDEKRIGGYLALCSHRLELEHPTNGKKLQFEVTPENINFER